MSKSASMTTLILKCVCVCVCEFVSVCMRAVSQVVDNLWGPPRMGPDSYLGNYSFLMHTFPMHFSVVDIKTCLRQVRNGLCRCGSLKCVDFLIVFSTFILSLSFKYGVPLIIILLTDSLECIERNGSE